MTVARLKRVPLLTSEIHDVKKINTTTKSFIWDFDELPLPEGINPDNYVTVNVQWTRYNSHDLGGNNWEKNAIVTLRDKDWNLTKIQYSFNPERLKISVDEREVYRNEKVEKHFLRIARQQVSS